MFHQLKTCVVVAGVGLFGVGFATAVAADGPKQLMVPKGMCPDTIGTMVRKSAGKAQYTAFAVPTARKATRCGEGGVRATMGIASDNSLTAARRAAIAVCEANRGPLGPCVISGFLRNKR